ncbi:MAG: SulP family inorganic anion transporter [Deltaproteobacteria bacterium]
MKRDTRGLRFPVLQGVLPVRRSQIQAEIIAGITLATLAIPEVMGYTKIAGMPVITGLYTILIPMALFAFCGSSRHLVVGADSATAAMLAAGLAGIAVQGSSEYVALAGIIALMSAVCLLLARIIGLGFLSDFLSRTVLVGFLTGVGIQVALGQIAGMIGIPGGGHMPVQQILNDWRQLEQTNLYALGLSLAGIAVVVGARFVSKTTPGALIAVSGAILASWGLDLETRGVRVLGAIPSGLPTFGLPEVNWNWHLFQGLLPTALAIFVVILAQSAATSRAYAARHKERFSENMDLIGLGVANLGAGLSGTFVVNGSPTKTQMVEGAGGHSQLAQLVTTGIVLMILLFFTAPLAYLPEAVLSAVVFLIGLELVDVKGMRKIYVERPWEFWVALITTMVVVFWGVEQGILLAIALSLVVHTRHGYRPRNIVLVSTEEGHWHGLPVSSRAQLVPGLLVYRFTHSMYYANAELLSQQVLALVEGAQPPLSWFCLDAASVDDVDFSAAEALLFLLNLLKVQGIRPVFAEVSDDVKAELDRSGVTELIGESAYYARVDEVVTAFRDQDG